MIIHVVCKFDFPLKYSRTLGEIADSTQTCGRKWRGKHVIVTRNRNLSISMALYVKNSEIKCKGLPLIGLK